MMAREPLPPMELTENGGSVYRDSASESPFPACPFSSSIPEIQGHCPVRGSTCWVAKGPSPSPKFHNSWGEGEASPSRKKPWLLGPPLFSDHMMLSSPPPHAPTAHSKSSAQCPAHKSHLWGPRSVFALHLRPTSWPESPLHGKSTRSVREHLLKTGSQQGSPQKCGRASHPPRAHRKGELGSSARAPGAVETPACDGEYVYCPAAGPASPCPVPGGRNSSEGAEEHGRLQTLKSVPSKLGTCISAPDIAPDCCLRAPRLLQLRAGVGGPGPGPPRP